MIPKLPDKRNEKYYGALGPSPEGILKPVDFYRFKLVKKYIKGDSVLDVGCGRADFLKLIEPDYQIAGIEVTEQRAEDCNRILGQDVVRHCNIEENIEIDN